MQTILSFGKLIGLCIALLFVTSQNLNAQTTLSIGPEIGLPLFKYQQNVQLVASIATIPVNYEEGTNTGFGASARLQHQLNDRISLFAKAAYMRFTNENFTNLGNVGTVVGELSNIEATMTAIPIQGGLKVYMVDGLYGSAEAGMHLITSKLDATILVNLSKKEELNAFSFAPGIGYEIDLGNFWLDVGAKYQYTKDFSYMNFSCGLVFPIGNR